MTIPAALIETSAEALFNSLRYVFLHPRKHMSQIHREVARIVLEAAFAALPECEEGVLPPGGIVDEKYLHGWNSCLRALAGMTEQPRPSCPSHKPLQHRDGKPPWCKTCGLTTNYQEPVSNLGHREFANPFLACDECGRRVKGRIDHFNAPCGHHSGFESVCPSWSPVEGCLCARHFGHVPHADVLFQS